MPEKFRSLSLYRWLLYGIYAVFGLLHAFTSSYPIAATEIFFSHQKMYDVWTSPSFNGLLEIPKRGAELGAILLFLASSPFFVAFKPCLAALHLGTLFWSLAGLVAIERALPDPAEGLLAAAVVGLGLSHDTLLHLSASGGHTQFLLPFGLTLFLASRFLLDGPNFSRRRAFVYGLCAVLTVVFMISMAIYMFLACAICLLSLSGRDAKRLVPLLMFGILVGAIVGIPLFLRQHEPTPHLGFTFEIFRDYASRFAWLLVDDLPTYLAIRGSMVAGYILETVLIGLVTWAISSGLFMKDPLLRIVVLWSIVMPFLLPLHPWYMPEMATTDAGRLRYFAMAWPAWGVLLGAGTVRLWKVSAVTGFRDFHRRIPVVAAGTWLLSGTFLSFATINYCHMGIGFQMPLSTPIGRILAHHGFPGMVKVRLLPEDIQGAYAIYRAFPLMYDRDSKPLAALEEMSPEFREPFLFGFGFMLCEGTVPATMETRAQLPALREAVPSAERVVMDRGCELAQRWRDGDVEIKGLSWPVESSIIACRSCGLLQRWEYWGTPKIQARPRPKWPLIGE